MQRLFRGAHGRAYRSTRHRGLCIAAAVVVCLAAVLTPSGSDAVSSAAASQTPLVATPGRYGPPEWFPGRGNHRIGCTRSNPGCSGYHPYWALDIPFTLGEAVYASGAGQVMNRQVGQGGNCDPSVIASSRSCPDGRKGNWVLIDHGGGIQSFYAHLSQVDVAIGAWVDETTIIGRAGHSGYSTPGYYHLHYEERSGSTSLRPRELLGCNRGVLRSYPSALGASWSSIPRNTSGLFSDSTTCRARVRRGLETIGVTAVTTSLQWELRNANASGAPLPPFGYGMPTDRPIVGDWDGDGLATVGIVRVTSQGLLWKLRNTNSTGRADLTFVFGAATDEPIVGDWDGNGTTTVGITRDVNGVRNWRLRNANSAGLSNVRFDYGTSAQTPIVGDWDGNGTTTVGITRVAATATDWRLRNANRAGHSDVQLLFGMATDTPVVGDWDGNGTTTVGITRNVAGARGWRLRNTNSAGPSNIHVEFGSSADTPVVGDWDGQ